MTKAALPLMLSVLCCASGRRGTYAAQHFVLMAEPCMRYIISARHRTSIEPIPGPFAALGMPL